MKLKNFHRKPVASIFMKFGLRLKVFAFV